MRKSTQEEPLRNESAQKTRPGSLRALSSVPGRLTAYTQLAFGVLLALLVLVVVQNRGATDVRFLVWEIDMPQALLIVTTMAFGGLVGAVFGWGRRRAREAQD